MSSPRQTLGLIADEEQLRQTSDGVGLPTAEGNCGQGSTDSKRKTPNTLRQERDRLRLSVNL